MNWSERYNSNNLENSDQQQPAAQNSIGHHLNQLYNMIWPEGPKTMSSDANSIAKMTTDPQKRDNAKAVVQSIVPYVKQKGKELGNLLQGRDSEGLDENGLMKPIASKSWNERYASEHYAIAAPNLNPNPITDEEHDALKQMGSLLNSQHLTFGIGKVKKDENYKRIIQNNEYTFEGPIKKRVVPGPDPEGHSPDSNTWDSIVKGYYGPDSRWAGEKELTPTEESKDAYKKMSDVGSYPKNPIINELQHSIAQQMSGDYTNSTLSSDSQVGSERALHHTILNAPTENVPELHSGIGHKGTSDDVLKAYEVGSTVPLGIRSWSAESKIAEGFANRNTSGSKDKRNVIFHLPAQSHALQVAGIGGVGGMNANSGYQEEYLGAAGHYQVQKHEIDENGTHHVHLTQASTDDFRPQKTSLEDEQEKLNMQREQKTKKINGPLTPTDPKNTPTSLL